MPGYDATAPDSFDADALARRPGLLHASDGDVRADPVGCATRALAAIAPRGEPVIVHFDIDCVDSRDLPLANYPHYGTGVPLAVAGEGLRVLVAAPGLAAVVLTEVNPTRDPDGGLLARYVETVAGGFS